MGVEMFHADGQEEGQTDGYDKANGRWAEHAVCMRKMRHGYKSLSENCKGWGLLSRTIDKRVILLVDLNVARHESFNIVSYSKG
jgi:hypothetical protein